MEQEKILLQIETGLADLKSFMHKIKSDTKLHKIDIDLIRQKIRAVYEVALTLESYSDAEMKATVSDIKQPHNIDEKEDYDDSFQREKQWNETKDNILKAEDLVAESNDDNETVENIEKEKPEENQNIDEPVKTEPDNDIQQSDKVINKFNEQQDLFSVSETVADKLSDTSAPTLAEKLTKKTLNSLKQYIGINDKFLFINELFGGDMSNYNSALAELDSLKTLEGVNTYLFELKIQNQWTDEMEAYVKLKELVEKKFSE